jgi:hypothetical protein
LAGVFIWEIALLSIASIRQIVMPAQAGHISGFNLASILNTTIICGRQRSRALDARLRGHDD